MKPLIQSVIISGRSFRLHPKALFRKIEKNKTTSTTVFITCRDIKFFLNPLFSNDDVNFDMLFNWP